VLAGPRSPADGRAAFRTGIGNVIEAGGHSLSTGELTLPEMLLQRTTVPYATAYFGKWHLERTGTTQACAPGLHGYQHFAGMLFQIPQSPGYCDWRERVCNGTSGTSPHSLEYMPGVIFDQAAAWMRARSGRWFALLAPQLPYDILHTPPNDLQTLRDDPACTSCAGGTRACFDAAIQALDTKLGHLFRTLARPIHEPSAATPRLPASAALLSLRGLDDLPEVASVALGRESLHLQAFATFRSRPHE
jgi:hypothetical protein